MKKLKIFKPTDIQLSKLATVCEILDELHKELRQNFKGNHKDTMDVFELAECEDKLYSLLSEWNKRGEN